MGTYSTEIQWFSSYLYDRVQRVNAITFTLAGDLFWGITLGSALGPLLLLIYVNDMPLQIQNGSLLQFADDNCLICYDDDHTQAKDFLSSDLDSLARWIPASKMQVNVEKSHVMWFFVKFSKYPTTVPPVLLEGTPLVNVSKQKYLEITIDSNLTWAYHVANVCKKMTLIIIYFDRLSSDGTS